MTIDQLLNQLNGCIAKGAASGASTFELNIDSADFEAINKSIALSFPSKKLKIGDVKPLQKKDKSVVVTGNGIEAPFKGMAVDAEFLMDDSGTVFLQFARSLDIPLNDSTVQLPVKADLMGDGLLVFEADTSGLAKFSVRDLAAYMKVKNFENMVPFSLDSGITVNFLSMSLDTASGEVLSLSVQFAQTSPWTAIDVGENKIIEVKDIQIELGANRPLSDSIEPFCEIEGTVELGSSLPIKVKLQYPDFNLVALFQPDGGLDLIKLIQNFIPSVEGIPSGLEIMEIRFFAQPSEKSYSLSTLVASSWEIGIANQYAALNQLGLEIDYDSDGVAGHLAGSGMLDDIEIDFQLEVSKDPHISISIPEVKFSTLRQKLFGDAVPALPKEIPEINFLDLQLDLALATGSFSVSGSAKGDWKIPLTGIEFPVDEIDLDLTHTVTKDSSGKSSGSTEITLKAKKSDGLTLKKHFPIHGDNFYFDLDLTFEDVAISYSNASGGDGKNKNAWTIEADGKVGFSGPDKFFKNSIVAGAIAESYDCKLSVGNAGVSLTVSPITKDSIPVKLQDIPFSIGDFKVDPKDQIHLGTAKIGVSQIMIGFGDDFKFSADVNLTLPSTVNDVFRLKNSGEPRYKLFKTDSPIDVEVYMARDKIGIRFKTSPFESFPLVDKDGDGKQWIKVEEESIGAIWIEEPELAIDFDNLGFTASGAAERDKDKDISLPLGWIKNYLKDRGMETASRYLPDSLPLTEFTLDPVKLLSILEDQLDEASKASMPESVKTLCSVLAAGMDELKKKAESLPTRFVDYFKIKVPDGFSYAMTITSSGGFSFDISVPEETPITCLSPVPLEYEIPALLGVRLRGVSLGEIFSGTFFVFKLDADFDIFDLPTLGAVFAEPDPEGSISRFCDSRDLQWTITIRKLFVLIEYESEVPIPIPIFFDDLGIDYLGLPGIGFASHWGFPEPQMDLMEIFTDVADLISYATNKDHLMNMDSEDRKVDLQIKIGANYVQLPPFLGGSVYGSKEDILILSGYQMLAFALNFIKVRRLSYLTHVFPLSYRLGTTVSKADMPGSPNVATLKNSENYATTVMPYKLGKLSGNVDWAVSTPEEFKTFAVKYLELADEKAATDFLASLFPKDIASPPDGVEQPGIVLAKGSAKVGDSAELDVSFSVYQEASNRYGFGVSLAGKVGKIVGINVGGKIDFDIKGKLDQPLTFVSQSDAEGGAGFQITFLEETVAKGNVQLTQDSLSLSGNLEFPSDWGLKFEDTIEGTLGSDKLYLHGSGKALVLGGKNLLSGEVVFTLENDSLAFSGEWENYQISLGLDKKGENWIFKAAFDNDGFPNYLKKAIDGKFAATKDQYKPLFDAKKTYETALALPPDGELQAVNNAQAAAQKALDAINAAKKLVDDKTDAKNNCQDTVDGINKKIQDLKKKLL